jgi:hypothetical protein
MKRHIKTHNCFDFPLNLIHNNVLDLSWMLEGMKTYVIRLFRPQSIKTHLTKKAGLKKDFVAEENSPVHSSSKVGCA